MDKRRIHSWLLKSFYKRGRDCKLQSEDIVEDSDDIDKEPITDDGRAWDLCSSKISDGKRIAHVNTEDIAMACMKGIIEEWNKYNNEKGSNEIAYWRKGWKLRKKE